MYNNISDLDRMVSGKLYNSSSEDIARQHEDGMYRCERFNKISVQREKDLLYLLRFTANMA